MGAGVEGAKIRYCEDPGLWGWPHDRRSLEVQVKIVVPFGNHAGCDTAHPTQNAAPMRSGVPKS
jgi:hypothetical protein